MTKYVWQRINESIEKTVDEMMIDQLVAESRKDVYKRQVHGGAWYFGQKRSVEFEPFLYGLNRGYACVSLGYTLSPEGHYPLPVLEIKSAIRFLRVHAEEYKLDPSRIVLWGGSAGAHLAALADTSCDTGYLEEDLSGNIQVSAKPNALVLWYGCFDYFEQGRYLEDWIYENFFGTENLEDVEEALRQSSPLMPVSYTHLAVRCLGAVQAYDPSLGELSGSLEEIETLLDDFNRSLAEYTDGFSFDEQQMRQTEERLDLINRLKTKCGQSVPEILDYAKEKQARIDILNDYDSYLEQLQRDYESSQKEFSRLADEISGIRKQYAGCLLYTSRCV